MTSEDDKFALDRARNYANWLTHGAGNVLQDSKTLAFWAGKIKTQRKFETMADEALDNAEKALVDALESLRQVRESYRALPKA